MLPLSQLSLLPRVSGIYLVIDTEKGEVIYVGQAKNIHKRWTSGHHKLSDLVALNHSSQIRIKWVELPLWLLNRAENAAIASYQPRLNLKMPPIV